jgi:uncharacterized protein (TIGR00299 family) protein
MSGSEPIKGKHLHLDCFAGIAGDMFLGAMLDLGVPEVVIREGLGQLEVGEYELRIGRAQRMGIEGCDVKVVVAGSPEQTGHGHRSWRSIRTMIEGSGLTDSVKRRAVDIFGRLAAAEARLHGAEPDRVEFHEVGAVDSIVDIVGAALALDYLAPVKVTSRPVPLGHGTTRCAHGLLPIPAPASLEILAGAAVEDGAADVELCTPTGAAILASCVEAFGQIPAAVLVAAGYGAGDARLSDRPNHLRVVLFEPADPQPAESEAVVVEANIDNMPAEWCGHLLERLFSAGARDVWYTPIVMKKGRPAICVSSLCAKEALDAVTRVMLTESTTIGLRHFPVGRRTLSRQVIELETRYGILKVKLALDGEVVLNIAPEYEHCRAAAQQFGVPLKEVFAEAMAAYRRVADSQRIS